MKGFAVQRCISSARHNIGLLTARSAGAVVDAIASIGAENGPPEVIGLAIESQPHRAPSTRDDLRTQAIGSRVSLPSWEFLEPQARGYGELVLLPFVTPVFAVEPAPTLVWARNVDVLGAFVGLQTFGASAPPKDLRTRFGCTATSVTHVARATLAATKGAA